MDEKDEYYSDFDRIEIRSDSNLAYIWVVEFRNWISGIKYPQKAILKGLKNATAEEFDNETRFLKELSSLKLEEGTHPAINSNRFTKYYHHMTIEENKWIFMELMESGDLSELIASMINGNIGKKWFIKEFFGIANALSHMHKLNWYHRDIKPENIFVTKEKHLKLGDFGASARRNIKNEYPVIGTPMYMSPELLWEFGCGNQKSSMTNPAKDDVWALAKTFFELATLQPAIDWSMSDEDVISRTVEYWFDLLLYSEDFKKVFLFMLHFSHSRRLGMDETVRMIKATEEYKTVSFNELQVNSLDFSSGSGASTLTIEGKYLIPTSEAQKSTLAIYERGINDREEEYKSDNIELTDKSDDVESYSIAESVKMYKSNRNDYRCKYCNDNIETTFFMLSCGHEYHLRCAENYVTETLEKAQRLGDVKCTVCRTKFSFEDTLMSGLFDFSENIIRKIEKLRLKRVNFLCVECNCKSSDSILDNQFLPYYLTCKNCNRTFCSFCKLSVRHYECTAFEQHLENFLHNYTESLR